MPRKKIAICHYRVGGTDGVSLEIDKRKRILQRNGYQVKLIAGARSQGADYLINELEWEQGITSRIKENGFVYFNKKDFNNQELRQKIILISDIIEKKLEQINQKEKFDLFLIHNIFCFYGHIPAAKAFFNFIQKNKIPTITTHHDFYWERKEFKLPRSGFLKKYFKTYLPPKSKYIKHVVINSITQKELFKRRGIKAEIIPDIFDFNDKLIKKAPFNSDFLSNFNIKRNDLVILQATRIVPRKGIEIAVDFVAELNKRINKLRNKKIYNGKKITKNSQIILILAGYYEKVDKWYYLEIRNKISELGVKARFIDHKVGFKRLYNNGQKVYSLWDCYFFADLVTLPSIWEGWGNQFIEAVFAKKPIVLFEYPVFKKDIKPEGYKYISLGSQFVNNLDGLKLIPKENLKKAVQKTEKWLLNKNLNKILERNFKLGKKYHSDAKLEDFLLKTINSF